MASALLTAAMLNRAFTNVSPANATFATQLTSAGANATTFANTFDDATLTDAQLSNKVLTNMGLLPTTNTSIAALEAALTDYFAGPGKGNRGLVVLQLANILSDKESDAVYGTAAKAWNQEVLDSASYSNSASNTVASDQPTPGKSVALTTSSETVLGTAGNDTLTATELTFLSGDVIIDTSAADSDSLTISLGADAASVATVSGVESIFVNASTYAKRTFDASGISSAKTITASSAGSDDMNVSLVNTGTKVVSGSGITNAFVVTAASASSVTVEGGSAATVTLSGGTTGTTVINAGTVSTTATVGGSANSGTVTITGSALTSATATGKTANVTVDTTGSSTVPVTISVTGTTSSADVANVSAKGTVSLTNASNLETLNLTGNGAAATYTITGAAIGTKLNFAGTQSVTAKFATDSFVSGETVTDSTTGGTTTLELTATSHASTVDLTKVGSDVILQSGVLTGTATYKLASGATFAISGTAAQSYAQTLNTSGVTATVGNANDSVTVDLRNASVSISSDSTSTTSEAAFNTVNVTSNTVAVTSLTADLGAATGTLNISGSKNVALTSSTALSVNASNLTAKLTATASASLPSIVGGSGQDVITIATGTTVTVDGGAGTDRVTITTDISGASIANFENYYLSGNISSSAATTWTGKTIEVEGSDTVASGYRTIAITTIDATTLDLSGITNSYVTSYTLDNNGGTSALSYKGSTVADIITGSNTAADTIDGSSGNDQIQGGGGNDSLTGGSGNDSIGGGAGNDVIDGGSGNDTIDGGASVDILTGGTGNDVFIFINGESGTTVATADQIKDFGSTDLIVYKATTAGAPTTITVGADTTAALAATVGTAKITNGVATFATDDDTMAEMIIALASALTTENTSTLFAFNGNTYMFLDVTTDMIIQLVGVALPSIAPIAGAAYGSNSNTNNSLTGVTGVGA